MIKVKEVSSSAAKAGVLDARAEKDYVISWVLFGVASTPFLKDRLIFKGGTAMRKVYFPNYRYSEDLEFALKGTFDLEEFKAGVGALIKWVQEKSGVILTLKAPELKKTEKFNFFFSYVGPLGGKVSGKNIKVEIGINEVQYESPAEMDLINEKHALLCYSLDEITADRMCYLMQRTTPRDLYDLWYLLEMSGNAIEDCVFAFEEKARHKNLDPKKLVALVVEKEAAFAKDWVEQLEQQLPALPEFRKVWRELEKSWRKYQRFTQ